MSCTIPCFTPSSRRRPPSVFPEPRTGPSVPTTCPRTFNSATSRGSPTRPVVPMPGTSVPWTYGRQVLDPPLVSSPAASSGGHVPFYSGAYYPVTCWVATPRSQSQILTPMPPRNIAPGSRTRRSSRSGHSPQTPNTSLDSGTCYPITSWTPHDAPRLQPQIQMPQSHIQPPPQVTSGVPTWFYLNPCVQSPLVVCSPCLHDPPSQRTPWTPGGASPHTGQPPPPVTPAQGPAPMVPPTTTLAPSFVAVVSPIAPAAASPYAPPPNIAVGPPTPPTVTPWGASSTSCAHCGCVPTPSLCRCWPSAVPPSNTPRPAPHTPAMNVAGLPTPPRTPLGGRPSCTWNTGRAQSASPANPTPPRIPVGAGCFSTANIGLARPASPANLTPPRTPVGGRPSSPGHTGQTQPIVPAAPAGDSTLRYLNHQLRRGIDWDVTTHPENAMFICPQYGAAALHPGAAAVHPGYTEIEVCVANEEFVPWFQEWGNIAVRHRTREFITVKQVLKAMYNYFRQPLTPEEMAKLPLLRGASGQGRPRRRAEVLHGSAVLVEMWDETPPGQVVPRLKFRLST